MGNVLLSLISILGSWHWTGSSDILGPIDQPENYIKQFQITGASTEYLTIDWVSNLNVRKHVEGVSVAVVDEPNELFDFTLSLMSRSSAADMIELRDCKLEKENVLTCITSSPDLEPALTVLETFERIN